MMILLTVVCITYNHENFIEDAINGILLQNTNFSIEIIIHDDASVDKTVTTIKKFEQSYPSLIKTVLQNTNQFSTTGTKFIVNLLSQAKGKYIAICEGDDYWTDPYKLQKQVDFLEANPDFSICFHKVQILKDDAIIEDYITQVPSKVSTIYDLIKGNYIHTPSCVFRNRTDKIFGDSFSHVSIADYYIHIMNAVYGKIYYIDEPMAVYRIHPNSFWSSRTPEEKSLETLISYICIFKDLSKVVQDVKLQHYLKKHFYLYSSALIPSVLKYVNNNRHIISNSQINLILLMYSEMCEELNELYNRQEFASYYLQQALINIKTMFLIMYNKIRNGYYTNKLIRLLLPSK